MHVAFGGGCIWCIRFAVGMLFDLFSLAAFEGDFPRFCFSVRLSAFANHGPFKPRQKARLPVPTDNNSSEGKCAKIHLNCRPTFWRASHPWN